MKRNSLMTSPYIRAWGRDPGVTRKLWDIAENKREFQEMLDSFNVNLEKVKGVLQTANYNSAMELQELRHYVKQAGRSRDSYAGTFAIGGLVLGGFSYLITCFGSCAYYGMDWDPSPNIFGLFPGLGIAGGAVGAGLDLAFWAKRKIMGPMYRDYADLKRQADRGLNAFRVDGENQLQFAFMEPEEGWRMGNDFKR